MCDEFNQFNPSKEHSLKDKKSKSQFFIFKSVTFKFVIAFANVN